MTRICKKCGKKRNSIEFELIKTNKQIKYHDIKYSIYTFIDICNDCIKIKKEQKEK